AGKVLYFPRLGFRLSEQEQGFLRPDIREPKTRNISLNVDGSIKG
ncbi:MAG: Kdo hydroxylase family protein, partial [Ottowia sp.]|nr:Kdo hydroxylase family protein [Ottowia sp.]